MKEHPNITIYLSFHPPFMADVNKAANDMVDIIYKYKTVLNSDLKPLKKEALKSMILCNEKYPSWGTKHGNFFEIVVTNSEQKTTGII